MPSEEFDESELRHYLPMTFGSSREIKKSTQRGGGSAGNADSLKAALKGTEREKVFRKDENVDDEDDDYRNDIDDEEDDDGDYQGMNPVDKYYLPVGHEIHLSGHNKVRAAHN